MKKSNFWGTLFMLTLTSLANASAGECHFEADVFQCSPGYVASSCFANGHFGVKGCTCCPERTFEQSKIPMDFLSTKVLADGVCRLTKPSGVVDFSIHSEVAEKQALGFAGVSGARHRLEFVNNSATSFVTTSLIQVAVDHDDYLKNPPELCPIQPVDEGIRCERANNSLYPPFTHFAAFDNADGIAISDGGADVYRKSLAPSKPDEEPIVFEASKTIDNVDVYCKLTVSHF